MGYVGLDKCGFLNDMDCLKDKCPLKAWIEDGDRGICLFDIVSLTVRRMVSGLEKLTSAVKGMSKEEMIMKGIELWKKTLK